MFLNSPFVICELVKKNVAVDVLYILLTMGTMRIFIICKYTMLQSLYQTMQMSTAYHMCLKQYFPPKVINKLHVNSNKA